MAEEMFLSGGWAGRSSFALAADVNVFVVPVMLAPPLDPSERDRGEQHQERRAAVD